MTDEARVLGVIGATLRRPAPTPGDALADLGADSLDSVAVVLALEEEFGVGISDAEVETMRTAQDCVRAVENALAARAG